MHLVDGSKAQGMHAIQVNTSDLPAGRYFFRLQTDESVIVKSMMVVQ
jgi:hypothetical protein